MWKMMNTMHIICDICEVAYGNFRIPGIGKHNAILNLMKTNVMWWCHRDIHNTRNIICTIWNKRQEGKWFNLYMAREGEDNIIILLPCGLAHIFIFTYEFYHKGVERDITMWYEWPDIWEPLFKIRDMHRSWERIYFYCSIYKHIMFGGVTKYENNIEAIDPMGT